MADVSSSPHDPDGGADQASGDGANEADRQTPLPMNDRMVFKFGVAIGITLVVIALAMSIGSFGRYLFQWLVLTSGLAILFGAFGSRATAKLPVVGATVSGAAAIAVVLLFVVQLQGNSGFLVIRITGDVGGSEVLLRGDKYYHSIRSASNEQEFIIVGNDINAPTLKLEYTPAGNSDDRIFFNCIMKESLSNQLGSGDTIEWVLHLGDNPRLENRLSNELVSQAFTLRCGTTDEDGAELPTLSWMPNASRIWSELGIGSAHAQQVEALVEGAQLPQAQLRAGYRDDLARIGAPAVRPLLDALRAERAATGAINVDTLVALNDVLSTPSRPGAEAASVLVEADRELLVAAMGDDNKAVRFVAADVIYALKDEGIVLTMARKLPELDQNGRNNALIVGVATMRELDRGAQARVQSGISRLTQSGALDNTSISIADRIGRAAQ